ncbi:MAG TPA: hypothetical protein VFI31_20465, partial [Pirellulales bacterium]|nr:hypothetical protein [Pirellulales bacterium]
RIKVWHLPTGKLWATTVQLETVPTQLAFSSDSKLLASGAGGDAEGLTVVWQLPDQRPSGSSSDKSSGVVSADPVAKDGARATTSAKSPAARMPPANAQLAAALRKAGKLVREQRADTDEFRRTLQGVAGDLPILPSSANLAPDGWLNLTLNSSGTGFDAYRFTSTLDGPADLCIAFVEPREETNWYVLPVTGQMEAANDFDREDALDLPGVDKGRSVIFQLLAQGTIAPRAEYILWFATKATEAVELKLLWKVVPRGTIQDKPTSDSVAKELGLKTPLRFLVSSSAEPLKRLSALRHGAPVRSLAFSPDGTTLATGGGDNQVRLWERTRGTLRQTVPGAMVVFAPDGLSIATAATIDGPTSVAIWDATSGQQCHRLEGAHLRLVEQLAFSPDGSRLASGCRGGIVTVWDTATGRQAWQPELAVSPRTNRHRRLSGHQAGVLAAAFSPKDDLLVTGGSDSFVLQWSMASGGMAGQIEWHRPSTRCGLQRRRQVDRLGRERQYDSSLHLCSRARRAHHESPRP